MMYFVRCKKIIVVFFGIYIAISSLAHSAYALESLDKLNKDNFLALADIHFDPFIACYKIKEKPCPLIVKLQQTPSSQWGKIFAEYDTGSSLNHQDTNYQLLVSMLAEAKKTADNKHVKFVLVLGDFLGHDFKKYYKKYSPDKSFVNYQLFVKNTLAFVTNQIHVTFPDVSVYGVIGNNDSYHADYSTDMNGKFFHDTGSLWSGLIINTQNNQAMQRDFSLAGYYAVDMPELKNVRLIVMNSVLFSYKAKGKGVADAANEELNWLNKQLNHAHTHHQKAIIAMHIPMSVDIYLTQKIHLFTFFHLWKPIYSERFKRIMQQYSADIAGVFSGHLHSDWDQIFSFPGIKNEIPLTGTPSVSPIFGNNPGYKVYSFISDPFQLYDSDVYYFPIADNHILGKTSHSHP